MKASVPAPCRPPVLPDRALPQEHLPVASASVLREHPPVVLVEHLQAASASVLRVHPPVVPVEHLQASVPVDSVLPAAWA